MLDGESLDLRDLRAVNVTRAYRWHGEQDTWTGADWSNAMCGEAGETANMVKKLRRIETGVQQPADALSRDELVYGLGDEIADVIIYADLLARYYAIDLAEAVRRKFNIVSDRYGFPDRL